MSSATMSLHGQDAVLTGILARAQGDAGFRRRLLGEPKAVLGEAGIVIPAGLDLRMLDGSPDLSYVILPQPPAEGEVADHELAQAAGGTTPVCVGLAITLVTYVVVTAVVTAVIVTSED